VSRVNVVHVLPIGTVEDEVLVTVGRGIQRLFKLDVCQREPIGIPEYAFDAVRQQYSSELILRHIISHYPKEALRFLAVTNVDLFIPMLTFVFGQAQLRGRASVVSFARMRQEFYGLPQNRELMLKRIFKESLHELAHTFGLTHCQVQSCLMSIATGTNQLDEKEEQFCRECLMLLHTAISSEGRR
jgi:archaemetzincin